MEQPLGRSSNVNAPWDTEGVGVMILCIISSRAATAYSTLYLKIGLLYGHVAVFVSNIVRHKAHNPIAC